MTKVMIADAMKPSLVMSSEVFKDKIPGSIVLVAATGEQAVRIAAEEKPDLCLVDFDLPDVDGPALVLALRKVYDGPILMTAYPDQNVESAVLDNLFAYNDASAWIKKPVRFDDLAAQIERFLVERRRTGRRFRTNIPMKLVAKAEGRGKRAPKAVGQLINLSLGGACIKVASSSMKMKKKQEITLAFSLPSPEEMARAAAAAAKKTKSKKKPSGGSGATKTSVSKGPETKIKATVAWISKEEIGLQFAKLNDVQLRELEVYLKAEVSSAFA